MSRQRHATGMELGEHGVFYTADWGTWRCGNRYSPHLASARADRVARTIPRAGRGALDPGADDGGGSRAAE